jgi:hypothetical protein
MKGIAELIANGITRQELEDLLNKVFDEISKLNVRVGELKGELAEIIQQKVVEYQGKEFAGWKMWDDKLERLILIIRFLKKDFTVMRCLQD